MSVERTGPVTCGQLSVLRSLESYGPTGQTVANLVSLWDVPPGAGVAHIVDAWQHLVAAHESLRTTYSTENGRPVQVVRAPQAVSVPSVEVAEGTEAATRKTAAEWAAEPIDMYEGPPWRAFVAVRQGVPLYLVTVIHHIAADNGALQILRQQFHQLVDGDVLEPQVQPVDLALSQQTDSEIARAVDHWTRHWGPFLPEDRHQGDTSTRRRATIYSVEGLRAARSVSRRTGVSIQSILLAVGGLALARLKQREEITFGLMTANRLHEPWSSLVSSLNQCVPLSVRIDEDAPPDLFLRATYQAGMNAYLHGCFDVDALKGELNRTGHHETDPTYFSSHYNYLGKGDGEPPVDSPLRTSVAWRTSRQRIGPNFHLAVAVEQGLFIGVGASTAFLPDDLPAVLAASIEGGLMTLAEEPPESLRKLRLDPRRDIGRS
ncbi:condensation domain-containing protein [Streptomyces sp. S.PNR 29]|uniref:condensation domain-containing protein n=1 Tax=Streptomyces sp. S.PNR 29 TaxID=2973805 RepID=UPI0025B269A0|nr:condensation domain-containing protein [Streptomyces sp. S.PNR 29]MDN0197611.1 condensation domain-containing protein [Streptomyces sp. S.PNR 29]